MRLRQNVEMLSQIYPTELRLNKAISFDTESHFMDINLPITAITNGKVSSKIYVDFKKRGDLMLKSRISHFWMEIFLTPLFL